MTEETQTVELPSEVIERIERRVQYTEFESASDYITYTLEEVLYHVEEVDLSEVDSVDEEQVQDRLKDLGYLNG